VPDALAPSAADTCRHPPDRLKLPRQIFLSNLATTHPPMGMPRRPSMRFLLPRPAHFIALGLGAGHNDARWLRKREREDQLLAEVRRHAAQRFRGTNSPPLSSPSAPRCTCQRRRIFGVIQACAGRLGAS